MTDTPRTLRSSHLVLMVTLLGALLAILMGVLAPAGTAAPTTVALVLGGMLAITAGLSKTCTP